MRSPAILVAIYRPPAAAMSRKRRRSCSPATKPRSRQSARIIAEASPGTRLKAIIEVENAAEHQPLPSQAELHVEWLHRQDYAADGKDALARATMEAIGTISDDTFVWVACEKEDARRIRRASQEPGS